MSKTKRLIFMTGTAGVILLLLSGTALAQELAEAIAQAQAAGHAVAGLQHAGQADGEQRQRQRRR
ncbi:MAG: hypothetical protein ACOCVU_06535, partial [Desulfohalobiaceae bacterium]